MNPTLAWIVTALATASPVLAGDGTTKSQSLFHFAKSDSSNEVHYTAQIGEDCQFAPRPIHVYWMRRGERLEYRRELNWAEKQFAYGVDIQQRQGSAVIFTIAGDTSRSIRVELTKTDSGCRAEARMRILGQRVKPEHAFIELRDRKPMIPKVIHVDLLGRKDNDSAVCERITEVGIDGTPCQ